ncbi:ATP-binding protein [Kutzneria chonburiensis]|uniref:ATP-binding protein n=1 Tax=Kutzneria chonburiensis TaxID=1483604 RepID=A0ABV6MMI4_9PSEU|nr:ATP-binding protein [Kutzneria chonburiensis]
MIGYRTPYEHLADELRRLDLLIGLRLAAAALHDEASQTSRAVYIGRAEVDRLLTAGGEAQPIAEGVALKQLSVEIEDRVQASGELPLITLGQLFGLNRIELGAVLICLAPELRRKYDRIYAYAQDDITRKRPSVDLVLELLCDNEPQRWSASALFTPAAPLLRHGILHLVDDPGSPSGSSGLAQFLALDQRIRQFLIGSTELDAMLAGHTQLIRPAGAEITAEADQLARLAEHEPNLVCYLHGPVGVGKRDLAVQACDRLGVPLISVDTDDIPSSVLRRVFREAVLQGAAVHIAGQRDLRGLAEYHRLVFVTGEEPWTGGMDVHQVAVTLPDADRATAVWREHLAPHTRDAAVWAAELANRYQLPPARIRSAVRLATRMRATEPGELTLGDVSAACRRQSSRTLGDAAVKVDCRAGWDDLVLPADRVDTLREIRDQVRHREQVLNRWGFGRKLSHGKGLSVLFSGPPGTGKTMAAEVLAGELSVDLYKVDLSGVVSKYVGETERNLARIFAEARTADAVLFFDEADALFGKRTEVSDAHDRYANIETSYLLQQIEEHEGVVVLATNLRQNIDEAFTRRIRFVVEFPFPDAEDRARIWRTLVPPNAPLAADVDFDRLAREFAVTGANIRNIVLNAAFLAAADGGVIDRGHLLRGMRQEFTKIGKLWAEAS